MRLNKSDESICQNRCYLFLALFVIVILFSSSCRPMKEISIEVLKPAKVTLPGKIERIAFANRSSQPYLSRAVKDTSLRTARELYVIDTIFQKNHYRTLFETLSNDLVFNIEDKLVLIIRRSDAIRFPGPMSAGQLSGIIDSDFTDALICLDGYELKDSAFYWFSYQTYSYNVIFRITGKILWRIYDVSEGTVLDDYTIVDTMEWLAEGPEVNIATFDLPEVTDAYREFSRQTGSKYGLRLTPDWFNEQRYFYSGSWDMRYAAKKVGEDDWEEALKVWKELAGLNRKRLSAKAAYNIALYYEMDDRLVPALDWAKKSKEIHDFKLTIEYIRLLEKRIKDKLALQQQIPSDF